MIWLFLDFTKNLIILMYFFAIIMKVWMNGRQLCEERSLTGRHCVYPVSYVYFLFLFFSFLLFTVELKAWFKRRILHAPNRIVELSACKMRRLNQLNGTYFNSMRVQSIQSNIRLKSDSWFKHRILHVPNRIHNYAK